ncbi:MAG: OmpA family protein [Bacteroidetes bacterium]|nr:OmpA family protein [Bacteroidota bacterium]MBU1718179.1 OmpA family protein [Bacteroidota bacterium]
MIKLNYLACLTFSLMLSPAPSVFAQDLAPNEKEAHLKVIVTDFEGKARKGEIIIFENKVTHQMLEGTSNVDGKFQILIPKGATYLIKFRNFGDIEHYAEIVIPGDEGLISSEMQVKIQPPKTYTLDNVLFETGKATLQKSSFTTLDNLVEVLKTKTTLVIEIAGHTDNTGTPDGNMKLSQARAESVMNYLLSKGIPAKQVSAKGYGQNQPVATNDTDEGKTQNRRTEVRVMAE